MCCCGNARQFWAVSSSLGPSTIPLSKAQASTILMLPPSLPGNSAQSHKEEAAESRKDGFLVWLQEPSCHARLGKRILQPPLPSPGNL